MWGIDSWFVVNWSWLVVSWGWVVWGWVGFVDWSWFMVNWSWGWLVDGCWGWLVWSWGWVRFVSWLVSWLVGWSVWVCGFSFVANISDITVWASRVGDNLDTAIGKVYTIFSLGVVVISVFAMREDWAIVGVIYTVLEVVYWWGNDGVSVVGGCWGVIGCWSVIWCWGTSGGSNSACYNGSSDKNLKI